MMYQEKYNGFSIVHLVMGISDLNKFVILSNAMLETLFYKVRLCDCLNGQDLRSVDLQNGFFHLPQGNNLEL